MTWPGWDWPGLATVLVLHMVTSARCLTDKGDARFSKATEATNMRIASNYDSKGHLLDVAAVFRGDVERYSRAGPGLSVLAYQLKAGIKQAIIGFYSFQEPVAAGSWRLTIYFADVVVLTLSSEDVVEALASGTVRNRLARFS
jgi:hypothetical protein